MHTTKAGERATAVTPTRAAETAETHEAPASDQHEKRAHKTGSRVEQHTTAARTGLRVVRHPERGPLAAAVLRVIRPAQSAPTRRSIRPRNGRSYHVDHTPVHAQSARHARRITRQHRAGRTSVVALVAAALGVGLLRPSGLAARITDHASRIGRTTATDGGPDAARSDLGSSRVGLTRPLPTERPPDPRGVAGPIAYRLPPVVVSASITGNGSTHRGAMGSASTRRTFLQVDASMTNNDTQLLERCAVSCFAVVAGHSTVPYFSADAPRSVSLVYHGDRLAVRPFIYADVSLGAGAPAATELWLEATVNGSPVTFTNGDQRLRFAGAGASSGTVRLAGQGDASGLATGVYPMVLTVGAVYANSTTEQQTVTTKLLIVNERASPIARGWTVAGVPRLYPQGDGSALLTDGSGSAIHFPSCGTDCFTTPSADFSKLTATGSGTARTFTRAFVDSTKVLFDYTGRATSVTDRFGNAVKFGYDGAGRLTSITDPVRLTPLGQPSATVLTYGSYGLSQIQEPGADGTSGAGRSTIYTVASDSTLRVAKDPDGDSTRFGYDGSRRLSTVTDRRGQTTTFGYATSWKLASVQLPAITVGSSTTTTPTTTYSAWQAVGVPTSSTASVLATPARADTVRGTVTDARGAVSRLTVDRWGQPLTMVDPFGRVTTTVRSGLFPTTVTYPSGAVDSMVYSGQLLTSYKPAGRPRQTYQYGDFGIPTRVTTPGLATESYGLNAQGAVTSATTSGPVGMGALGWTMSHDSRGQITSAVDPLSRTTQWSRDSRTGSVGSVSGPPSQGVARAFDAAGRDSVTVSTDGVRRRYLYDPANRLLSMADTAVWNWETVQNRQYDGAHLKRFQDAGGNVHRFTRNALGWPTQIFDAADTLNRSTNLEYDVSGNVTAVTNRRGQRRTMAYDSLGRMRVRTTGATAADSFAFSTDNLIETSWNANGRDSLFYRANGWLDSTVTWLNGKRYLQTYTPDSLMRLRTVRIFGDSSTNFTRFATRTYSWDDSTGQLTGVDIARADSIQYGGYYRGGIGIKYNGWGLPDTSTYVRQYGGAGGFLTRIDRYTNNGQPYRTIIGSIERRFGYDSLGRIRLAGEVKNGTETYRRYRYDARGQLVNVDTVNSVTLSLYNDFGYRASSVGVSATFGYDAAGNRVSPGSLTYGPGNRATSYGMAYDLDGNLTPSVGQQFYWGIDGRLDSLAADWKQVHYAYDARGRLVRRMVDSTVYNEEMEPGRVTLSTTWYLWDGQQLLAEIANNGVVSAEFIHGGGVDRPLAEMDWSGTVRYYHRDAIGSVFAVSVDGTTQVSYAYSPWGDPVGSTKPGAMRPGWKGMLREPIGNLYYARNRWYASGSGRFLSEDPIGLAGGANLYVFAQNDPINKADPYGLAGCTPEYLERGWKTTPMDGTDELWCINPGAGQPVTPVVVTAPWTPPPLPPSPVPPVSPPWVGMPGSGGSGGGGGIPTQNQPPKPPPRVTGPLPSCASVEFQGNSGTIYVQTNPRTGHVQWGIVMHSPLANDGPWVVQQWVAGRPFQGPMIKPYYPHGSVPPQDARPGKVFSLTATHTDLFGFTYSSIANACVIP